MKRPISRIFLGSTCYSLCCCVNRRYQAIMRAKTLITTPRAISATALLLMKLEHWAAALVATLEELLLIVLLNGNSNQFCCIKA